MSALRRWWQMAVVTLLCLALTGTAVFAASPSTVGRPVGLATSSDNPFCELKVSPQKVGDKLIYTVTDRTTLLKLAKKYGWSASKGDATIAEAVFVVDQQSLPAIPQTGGTTLQAEPSDNVTPQWGIPKTWIVITGSGEVCGTTPIRRSYYQGPATTTMTVTESVSARWSATGGISASGVSAGVGFDVTKTYTVSDSYQVTVPAGKTAEVVAYPMYYVVYFDVWTNPVIGDAYKSGSGWAMKPSGVCFVKYLR